MNPCGEDVCGVQQMHDYDDSPDDAIETVTENFDEEEALLWHMLTPMPAPMEHLIKQHCPSLDAGLPEDVRQAIHESFEEEDADDETEEEPPSTGDDTDEDAESREEDGASDSESSSPVTLAGALCPEAESQRPEEFDEDERPLDVIEIP